MLNMIGSCIGALIILFSANTATAQNAQGITIERPVNEQTVRQYGETISFRTDVSVSNDESPIVFIKDPDNNWWPWLRTRPLNDERREWEHNKIQFGIEGDSNQDFQIQVLLFNRLEIDEGVQVGGDEHVDIEAGTKIKNSIFKKLRRQQQIKSGVISVQRE